MIGLEVEGLHTINDFPPTVVVAKIVSQQPHPGADSLSLCDIDDGSGEVLKIICGAPNCKPGAKVVAAKIGTKLPDGLTIKKAKIRGEYSYGMLCSEEELGLGNDHTGILILPDDTPVGIPLSDCFPMDTIIEWEITPNRPDWLSHIGVAREIAAVAKSSLRLPEIRLKEIDALDRAEVSIDVDVRDRSLCPRYTARVIRNVKVGPSPDWIQRALRAVGLRPINNIVDITNFVLLECGQPLHAFDLSKLSGNKIVVRPANKDEALVTLGDHTLILDDRSLVIADAERSIALAGIIGGENSEITERTTDVLLESAMFDPASIRRTVRQLGISTDSSYRFERGVDIEMVEFASARAAQLMCEYADGRLAKGFLDCRHKPFHPVQIAVRFDYVDTLLGIHVEPAVVESIFRDLGLQILKRDDLECVVSVPSFRKDLAREVDLVEEVVRLFGLNRIPAIKDHPNVEVNMGEDAYYPIQTARNELLALGLQECLTYSLTNDSTRSLGVNAEKNERVSLTNPLSIELSVLRSSLLPGMIEILCHNIAHSRSDLRLFEIGRVFSQQSRSVQEYNQACIALTGRRNPERYSAEKDEIFDFYDLRGLIEDWMERRRFSDYQLQKGSHPAFESGVCAELIINEEKLGVMGQLTEKILASTRAKHPVYVAIVNLENLPVCTSATSFCSLPQFPFVTRDVAFLADENLDHQTVMETIKGVNIEYLERIELVDIFRDDQRIGLGKKSMAYTLTFRSREKTLSDKEVNRAQEKIRLTMLDKLPIQLR